MRRLGRYTLGPLLGEGGAGKVYAATIPGPDGRPRPVAIKTLEFFGRFLAREARIAAMLRHPGLVDVYEVGQADGLWFCAMERCEGRLADHVPLPPSAVVDAVVQVCEALAWAHESLELVHLDLKPQNLLLRAGRVKVADFGISTARGFDGLGARVGTPGYMAPEVLSGGTVDTRADVFGLGRVLLALVGAREERALPTSTLDALGEQELAPEAPAWLAPVVARCLCDDPAERFADLSALAEALRGLDVQGPSLAAHLGLSEPAVQTAGPSPLFGRKTELDALGTRLRSPGVTVLVGPGGMGKSVLAREALARHHGATLTCELAEASDVREVLTSVARTLGTRLGTGDDDALAEQISLALAARGPVVLMLDTAERSAAVLGPLLTRWAARMPGLRVVVTSRIPLVDHPAIEVGPLDDDSARALLEHGAQQRGVDVAGQPALTELVRRLEGWPLSLELAAARLGVLTPEDLLQNLTLSFLRGGERRGPARHATLQQTLDWSWDLLSPDHRAVLAQLSVFRGGFTIEALEAVVEVTGDPLTALEGLRQRALVALRDGRLRLLDPVREYAAQRGEVGDAADRHSAWFSRMGTPEHLAALEGAGSVGHHRALLVERDNLLGAIEHAVDHGLAARATLLLSALERVLAIQGPATSVLDWARRVLAVPGHDDASELQAQRVEGHAHYLLGHLAEAGPRLDRVIERAAGVEATEVLARALNQRGACRREAGDREGAIEDYCRCIETTADAGLASAALQNRGLAQREIGEMDAAWSSFEEALDLARSRGDVGNEAITVGHLGMLHSDQGRTAEARDCYERALELHERLGSRRYAAVARYNLGLLELNAGHVARARARVESARAQHLEVGNRRSAGICELQLIWICVHEGDAEGALAQAQVALSACTELDNPRLIGFAEQGHAEAALLAGDLDAADAATARSSTLFHRIGDRGGVAECDILEGRLLAAREQPEAAIPRLAPAVRALEGLNEKSRWSGLAELGLLRVVCGDAGGLDELDAAVAGLTPGHPGTALITALGKRAQALACMGRHDEARAAVSDATRRLEALGLSTTGPAGLAIDAARSATR